MDTCLKGFAGENSTANALRATIALCSMMVSSSIIPRVDETEADRATRILKAASMEMVSLSIGWVDCVHCLREI